MNKSGKSSSQNKGLKEGTDINKGLLVLGNVISTLGDPTKSGKSFVPQQTAPKPLETNHIINIEKQLIYLI